MSRDEVPYTNYSLEECIRRGAAQFDWKTRWRPQPGSDPGPIKRGAGVRHDDLPLGSRPEQRGHPSRLRQASYALFVGVTDVGAGAKTTMGLIAAEALGVPLVEKSRSSGAIPDRCPYSVGESGSRTTIMTGYAVVQAARRHQEADRRERRADRQQRADRVGDAQSRAWTGKVRSAFGAHFVEVEVDTELGRVRSHQKYVDGPRLRPDHAIRSRPPARFRARRFMGIGHGAARRSRLRPASGQPADAGYYVRSRADAPATRPTIEVMFIEIRRRIRTVRSEEHGRSRASILAPAAIANAIFNAIGRRMKDLPITRDKIPGALGMKTCRANQSAKDRKGRRRAAGRARRDGRGRLRTPAAAATCSRSSRNASSRPDVIVSLKTMKSLDQVNSSNRGLTIGGLTTIDAITKHATIRQQYAVLAESAADVATPQIRNVATIAGNVCQRPWCWYFRNGFPATRRAATSASRSPARTSSTPSSAAGRATSSIRPDTAPALVALDARFKIVGPSGERHAGVVGFLRAAATECRAGNSAGERRGPGIDRSPGAASRHAQHLLQGDGPPGMDARRRQRRRRPRDGRTESAAPPGSSSVALRRFRGGWRLSRRCSTGQRHYRGSSRPVPAKPRVEGARPLSKNAYKVPLTKNMVKRTILELASRQV